jgi:acetyl esterase/lipase
MAHLAPRELRRFNAVPVEGVTATLDIDYVGAGARQQHLDVIAPTDIAGPLPVYVYFHGGGWTSGDKAVLTTYCANQARAGMIVVNVNYRTAPRYQMAHLMQDAAAALTWIRSRIAGFGGDPDAIVLGGDSAGGQIAALLAAAQLRPELAAHYGIGVEAPVLGVVQHCSANDFSVLFERGFILGLGFVRMLLPGRGHGVDLRAASRFLSPIEWVDERFPPVLVTTSHPDPFYRSNLNFVDALRSHGVPVELHVDERAAHTWQQDAAHPGSAAVYERLQRFVAHVAHVARVTPAVAV